MVGNNGAARNRVKALYQFSGGARFEFRKGRRSPWRKLMLVSLSPYRQMSNTIEGTRKEAILAWSWQYPGSREVNKEITNGYIRTWRKPSTITDTLVLSLYQCVETRSVEVFCLLSQPFPLLFDHHLRLSNAPERIPLSSCELLYTTNTSHRKEETFLHKYNLHLVLLPTKINTTVLCFSAVYSSSMVAILTTETSLWTWACTSAT
jgi:hypothetical protein